MAPSEIEVTDEFQEWFLGLDAATRDLIAGRIDLLGDHGPDLGRPAVDTLVGSKYPNMKELRVQSIRMLFMFDPRRQVIMLVGGDKAGQWSTWYERAIPEAERLFGEYLTELEEEGLLP